MNPPPVAWRHSGVPQEAVTGPQDPGADEGEGEGLELDLPLQLVEMAHAPGRDVVSARYGGVGQADVFGMTSPDEAWPRGLSPHAPSPLVR